MAEIKKKKQMQSAERIFFFHLSFFKIHFINILLGFSALESSDSQ